MSEGFHDPESVGFLTVNLKSGRNFRISVTSESDFYLGRDPARCQVAISEVDDFTVSARHLRIYVVNVGDSPDGDTIEPLVYAQNLSRNGTTIIQHDGLKEHSATQNRRLFSLNSIALLQDNDTLLFGKGNHARFESCFASESCHLAVPIEAKRKLLERGYKILNRKIGEGRHPVYLAKSFHLQKQFACKIVDIQHLKGFNLRCDLLASDSAPEIQSASNLCGHSHNLSSQAIAVRKKWNESVALGLRYLEREIETLKSISNPNVINLEKVYKSSSTIYIIQELITGGDLFSYISTHNPLKDAETAAITYQILKAVEYLHSKHIVHRDLKPENILLSTPDVGTRVIVADFGHARYIPGASPSQTMRLPRRMKSTTVGTTEYAAPEISESAEGYTKAVDIWSTGSITYAMLSGGETYDHSLDYERSSVFWRHLKRDVREFTQSLLESDPGLRPTAKEALQHSWFTDPAHALALQKMYARAISSFRPRLEQSNVIEFIDTNDAECGSEFVSIVQSEQQVILGAQETIKNETMPANQPCAAILPSNALGGVQNEPSGNVQLISSSERSQQSSVDHFSIGNSDKSWKFNASNDSNSFVSRVSDSLRQDHLDSIAEKSKYYLPSSCGLDSSKNDNVTQAQSQKAIRATSKSPQSRKPLPVLDSRAADLRLNRTTEPANAKKRRKSPPMRDEIEDSSDDEFMSFAEVRRVRKRL